MDAPIHRMARVVAFADTDASGWVHFANVFRYAEEAEHEFLRSRGLALIDVNGGGWPRVKVSCDYQRPLQAGDGIEVLLEVVRMGGSSVAWRFEIVTDHDDIAATGEMTTVRVDCDGKAMPIPDHEREALQSNE